MKEAKTGVTRYSDEDLAVFKELLEKKLAKAQKEMDYLREQLLELTENADDDRGDWMDDSANGNEIEFLNTMTIRIRKHVRDLENALLRIRNRTYGVCLITGDLIDKKRLMAVPTATKSLAGKLAEKTKEIPGPAKRVVNVPKPTGERKIISRVIKPQKPKVALKPEDDFDDEDNDKWIDTDLDIDDNDEDSAINLDDLSEEDLA